MAHPTLEKMWPTQHEKRCGPPNARKDGPPNTKKGGLLTTTTCFLEAEVHDDVDVIPGDINAHGSADIARVVHDFAVAFA